MTVWTATRKLRAEALGYFWLPCPVCGQYFSGEEWRTPERAGDHFASIPTDVRDLDGAPWVWSAKGICPSCTDSGAGCRAHAEHRVYHAGCEAVPPPRGDAPYTLRGLPGRTT